MSISFVIAIVGGLLYDPCLAVHSCCVVRWIRLLHGRSFAIANDEKSIKTGMLYSACGFGWTTMQQTKRRSNDIDVQNNLTILYNFTLLYNTGW